ncbi:MAG TPA: nucleotide sugar dehydrogenase [Polyangiaceae bacterium]
MSRITVTVVGLGYVGCVVAASLAAKGVTTYGVDVKRAVVDALARGIAPVDEPKLAERIQTGLAKACLLPMMDLAASVAKSDVSLICVGTPLAPDGTLVDTDVLAACEAIARAAVAASRSHTIVIRSTVPSGMHERVSKRLRSAIGAAFGELVTLALNPEFLREGTAVRDVEEPELVVYATLHEQAAQRIEVLYEDQRQFLVRTDPGSSEILKLVANVWHALKVSFANEVARIAEPAQVDPFAVMDLLCKDKKLNVSAAYLRPGLPFGGACLTKDVSGLAMQARTLGVEAPMISSILGSNSAHVDYFVRAVMQHQPKRAAVVGIGFKAGTTDVRDSAPMKLVQALLDAGVEVSVVDSAVLAARIPPLGLDALRAALRDERARPSASIADAVQQADVIVAAHPCPADCRTLAEMAPAVPIIDAAGELTRALSAEQRARLNLVHVIRRR